MQGLYLFYELNDGNSFYTLCLQERKLPHVQAGLRR